MRMYPEITPPPPGPNKQAPKLPVTKKRKAGSTAGVRDQLDGAIGTAATVPETTLKRRKVTTAQAAQVKIDHTEGSPPASAVSAAATTLGASANTTLDLQQVLGARGVTLNLNFGDVNSRSAGDDGVPVKVEDGADRLQELSETNTRLGQSVAKLMDAKAKEAVAHAHIANANAKLTETNASLVERLIACTSADHEGTLVKQAKRVTDLEAELQESKGSESEAVRQLGDCRSTINDLETREQAWRDEVEKLKARIDGLERGAPASISIYESQNLDIYGTEYTLLNTVSDRVAEGFAADWRLKVNAMLAGNSPNDVIEFGKGRTDEYYLNHPMVHRFEELDAMWQYLRSLP